MFADVQVDLFRQQYSKQLRDLDDRELEEEMQSVRRQALRTPGRQGEEIKQDEIANELVRRHQGKPPEQIN
jgi:hypothetical protein